MLGSSRFPGQACGRVALPWATHWDGLAAWGPGWTRRRPERAQQPCGWRRRAGCGKSRPSPGHTQTKGAPGSALWRGGRWHWGLPQQRRGGPAHGQVQAAAGEQVRRAVPVFPSRLLYQSESLPCGAGERSERNREGPLREVWTSRHRDRQDQSREAARLLHTERGGPRGSLAAGSASREHRGPPRGRGSRSGVENHTREASRPSRLPVQPGAAPWG